MTQTKSVNQRESFKNCSCPVWLLSAGSSLSILILSLAFTNGNSVALLSLEKVKETSAELKTDGVEAEQIRSNLERCLRLKAFSIGVQSIRDVEALCSLQFLWLKKRCAPKQWQFNCCKTSLMLIQSKEEPEEDNEMEVGEIRDIKDAATLLSDVLNIFSTYKLERLSSKAQLKERSISTPAQNGTTLNGFCKVKLEENSADQKPSCSTSAATKEDNFFAKYLTNQKLFNLQLADSQFRRYFLVQALILTNYLLNKAKLKESLINLTQSQENFIKEVTDKCHTLLKETYPQGAHFADSVRRTLGREKMWSTWKSDGCPDLISSLMDAKTQLFKKRPVKRYDPTTIDLGNKELTRLWNIAPDNLAACMAKTRNCVPQLKQFIEDGLDELDPSQEVEEQYRSVNDEKYQWMASRFLLYNSDHYMNCVNTDPKAPRQTTAKFLEKATQMTALFMPELKEKAEHVQSAIAKKKADEEAEKIKIAKSKKLN
uniref:Uncharacterized protein n=1 Tax=Ditylenchus dipsaci TaxID=166011 RepID=A0A915D4L0_9BILA